MKNIKNLKTYIPTWIISLFMVFWVFIWPLFIGVLLIIIQSFQIKKIKKYGWGNSAAEKDSLCPKVPSVKSIYKANVHSADVYERDSKIEYLINFIKEKDEIISSLEKDLADLLEESYESENVSGLKLEIENLKKEISKKDLKINQLNQKLLNKTDFNNMPVSEEAYPEGQYIIGRDLPAGIYTFFGKNQFASVTLFQSYAKYKKDDEMTYNDFVGKYRMPILEENTYLVLQNCYIEKIETNNLLSVESSELETIKAEIKSLNDECIQKYYLFSDYDSLKSEDCKNKLVLLKNKENSMRLSETDVNIIDDSRLKRSLKYRVIRKMLRMFNCECDNIFFNISLKNIDSCRNNIRKSYETINMLHSDDGIELSSEYLELKLEQASLLYTQALKVQQEREIQRAIKEQMVEEAKAQKEIEEQKKKIEKDLQQHIGEVNRLMRYMQSVQLDAEKEMYLSKIKELEEKIESLQSDKENVLQREENAKAGYVYIISNIGSFGEDVYKIGMTRRLEPMDRIYELSSASVPFSFDVHAMIFSSNAPELENMLHKHFSDNTINKVNPRKEFFRINIDEIERVVKENYNDTVQFTKIPIATEYRQSLNMS